MKRIITAITCLLIILPLFATINFKNESVLSKGKWIKIEVTDAGVYELSYSTLKKYGFSNPNKVKVYGKGGNVLSEDYLLPRMDDLEQTPTMHKNNKIYFYTKGISKDSIRTTSDGIRIFIPKANPYSNTGALFLTDEGNEAPLKIENLESKPADNIKQWNKNGFGVWSYEEELYNPGSTGQSFLGKDFTKDKEITFFPNLPAYNAEGKLYLTDRLCLYGTDEMETNCQWNGQNMTRTTANIISGNDRISYLEYGIIEHGAYIDASTSQDNKFSLKISINTPGKLKKAWVDYASIIYPTFLGLPETESQIRHYADINTNGLKFVEYKGKEMLIWMVNEKGASSEKPYHVKNCITTVNGEGQPIFYYNKENTWLEFILFDPNKTQKQPAFAGEVKNQNLHGMTSIPNMLIITNSILKDEAERLAQFHREYDRMDVTVVNQDEIFNEFSGGNRDAMAYRLFCKMLYNRDPNKFKYLLLFGKGTYDNRMIYTNAKSEQLLTYQSEASNNQTKSYCTDDFFGFLDDSNTLYTQRKLQIAVGRIPVSSPKEAKTYIDKLIKYTQERDKNDCKWRNNIMLIAENGDDDIHLEQCETFSEKMIDSGNFDVNYNKLYLQCYDKYTVREKFLEYLNSGQYFALYVGHGTPTSLTKTQIITNLDKGKETKYPQLPIIYFSTCDVARYDNGGSNIVSTMFANENGGLIAAIASTRVVYTNLNGKLSDSFATSLAKLPEYYMEEKTIGNIFKDAKNNAKENSINKLKYCILGDPAIRLTPPENRIVLNAINGQSLQKDSKIKAALCDKVTLEGEIKLPDGTADESFMGNVIVQLYDKDRFLISALKTDEHNTRVYTDIYTRGKALNQTKADVINGRFSCSITIPNFSETVTGNCLMIRMIAEGTDGKILSGSNKNLAIDRTLTSEQSQDSESPTICSLYINDPNTFKDGMTVGSNFTVYGEVLDNEGINTSTESFVSSMTIALDSSKKTAPIYNYDPANEANGIFNVPFYDVDNGRHTIDVSISDLSGNIQRKTISFFVDNKLDRNLIITNPATATAVNFDLDNSEDIKTAEIFVTDSKGNILYNTNVSSFPYEWNLTDNNGLRLTAGDYNAYAKINNIGTEIKKIVILKQ